MAIIKSFIQQDGSEFPDAYWMVDGDVHQKLNMSVKYLMVGWKDRDYRNASGAACAAYTSAQIALKAASEDRAAQMTEEATKPKRVIEDAAQAVCEAARIEANKRVPFKIIQRVIDQTLYASIITNGAVDKSKIYALEKTYPEFAGAIDA